jgi:hypothetical protein
MTITRLAILLVALMTLGAAAAVAGSCHTHCYTLGGHQYCDTSCY